LVPKKIVVIKVETNNQLGDIFTKGLRGVKFEDKKSKLCGWEKFESQLKRECQGSVN
jgi:hypothetical protein